MSTISGGEKGQVPLFDLPRLHTVAIKLNFSIIWLDHLSKPNFGTHWLYCGYK